MLCSSSSYRLAEELVAITDSAVNRKRVTSADKVEFCGCIPASGSDCERLFQSRIEASSDPTRFPFHFNEGFIRPKRSDESVEERDNAICQRKNLSSILVTGAQPSE